MRFDTFIMSEQHEFCNLYIIIDHHTPTWYLSIFNFSE
jgi:hypothetical protein